MPPEVLVLLSQYYGAPLVLTMLAAFWFGHKANSKGFNLPASPSIAPEPEDPQVTQAKLVAQHVAAAIHEANKLKV